MADANEPVKAPWSVPDVLEVAASLREHVRERFMSRGKLPNMMTYFCTTRDPETGEDRFALMPLPQLTDFDNDGKNVQASLIRFVAQATMSVAVLTVMEAWYVLELTPETIKEWQGRLDEHPNRREGVMLFIEHVRFGTRCWRAEISRPASDGPPTLGDWDEVKDAKFRGRFTHLLPTVQ